ncbi:MAG: hypothetical protein HYV26_13325, partial [Candidatus Hydrogenedentes bacterium]|nr:hypothetical protein [Candidatus Hydrogenedentota bacterium]
MRDPKADPPPGSAAWCAKNLDSLTPVAAKYRLLTGQPDLDELIAQEESSYMQFRLHGNLDGLTQVLLDNAEALQINWPG